MPIMDTPAKTRRVVIRTTDKLLYIDATRTDVAPAEVTNDAGRFRLERAMPTYVLYQEVPRAAPAL